MSAVLATESLRPRLEKALRDQLGNSVRFDEGHLSAYASDASNYRQVPIGVVTPKSLDEVVTTVRICHAYEAPLLARGGGTSQNGQCVNSAVVMDLSRHCDHIVEIDPAQRFAVVEPGVICDSLRNAAEQHGLTFGPDPATHSRCTIGGMVGNDSCGAHSVMAGKTSDNTEALEVLTHDGARFWVGPTSRTELQALIAKGGRQGEIYAQLRDLRDRYADAIRERFPRIRRRVSGYSLEQLLPENGFNVARALVGTEGTCVTVLKAKLRLVHSPAHRVLLVLGYPDIYRAADAVPEFERFSPIAIEGLDQAIIDGLRQRGLRHEEIALLPPGHGWVVLEFGADAHADALAVAQRAAGYFAYESDNPAQVRLVADATEQQRIWLIRETGASATALSIVPGQNDPQVGWEDAAVDPHRLGDYLREFQALVDRFGYRTSLYGHFGEGCVHARIDFDLRSAAGLSVWREFLREASHLVVRYGGSLSGEHGDGQAKAEFLPIMYGSELMQAMAEFKAIWDPDNRMNPGKVIHAYRADENLRIGPSYRVIQMRTQLHFASDEGPGFQRAVERCIGMGRCRSLDSNTMCPSYRASREETQSTRGRSRLLWEMLQGETIQDGWNSQVVKKALDTCLACKGCRSDCPTHVDMASYKAEFLHQHYKSHRRPIQALSMGRIAQWAPWASRLSPLLEAFKMLPGATALAKRLGGIAAARELPRFAARTFVQRFSTFQPQARSTGRGHALQRVILWVDTFSNHIHPEVAEAAVQVLRHAGCEVILPKQRLCCGRPLYDFGLLDEAKDHLQQILKVLGPEIERGTPIVGLEPGCLSVFKDELLKQLPGDAQAQRLSDNSVLFADFVAGLRLKWPQRGGRALVHGHCHQKSIFGMRSTLQLLEAIGMQAQLLDSGCCGMAGGFGFHPEHYALSQKIGELVLLPAVRAADEDTLIVSDGYSCREQIAQGTRRHPQHLAQVLAQALRPLHPSQPGTPPAGAQKAQTTVA